jgi:hypothetical protein
MDDQAQSSRDESNAVIARNITPADDVAKVPLDDSGTSATKDTETDTVEAAESAESLEEVTSMVQQPAKVMRIGTMIKQLLEEVRAAPLDESGRARLRSIHESSIRELEQGLSPDLQAELHRLSLPFGPGIPSEAELRIAQAQLVGWLEGLFHGIQAAFAQQVAARQHELEQRALPGGAGGRGGPGQGRVVIGPGGQVIALPPEAEMGEPGEFGGGRGPGGTGQYL